MSLKINEMSLSDICALQEQLQVRLDALKLKNKNEIQEQHHPNFINQVGLDILIKIPVVEAKTLGLDVTNKYPSCIVTPAMLGNKSVVRGLDAANRPFIAIKVDLFDSQTRTKITQLVEVVLKRYSLNCDGANNASHGDNYVTALEVRGDDGNRYCSGLYSTGGMTDDQYKRVGQLLKGEEIPHLGNKSWFMQKA